MKNTIKNKLCILLMGVLLLSSCSDFLDQKYHGKVFPGTYPASTDNLESMVTSLYGMTNALYFKTGSLVACMAGDDVTTLSGGNKAAFLEFDLFNAQDNNAQLYSPWNFSYAVIKQSNDIINTIDNVTTGVSAEQMKAIKDRALGQAYFMRALAYFNLVRTFGRVPLVTKVEVDYTTSKAEFKDIYALIISDLSNAENLLPMVYSGAANLSNLESSTAYARVTSGAAKALMASVYLTMAGYPLKDESNYAKAAAKAKEIIDNESAYGYTLLPMTQLWKWQNGWKNTANAEGVFTCFFNTSSDWIGEGTNGNMLAPGMTPSEATGWNDAFAELDFYNEFPAGPRKDATFLTEVVKTNGTVIIPWTQFESKHPHYKKYMEMEGFDPKNMDNYIDWWSSRTIPVIRYSEVLLVYAEAQAMANGAPNDLAYTCINRVRNRAGLANMTSNLSSTAFKDSVVTERKWEFAGLEPNARWFDMVRTETVQAATSKRSPSDIPVVGQPNDQTHTGYFAPTPQGDKQLNTGL